MLKKPKTKGTGLAPKVLRRSAVIPRALKERMIKEIRDRQDKQQKSTGTQGGMQYAEGEISAAAMGSAKYGASVIGRYISLKRKRYRLIRKHYSAERPSFGRPHNGRAYGGGPANSLRKNSGTGARHHAGRSSFEL